MDLSTYLTLFVVVGGGLYAASALRTADRASVGQFRYASSVTWPVAPADLAAGIKRAASQLGTDRLVLADSSADGRMLLFDGRPTLMEPVSCFCRISLATRRVDELERALRYALADLSDPPIDRRGRRVAAGGAA